MMQPGMDTQTTDSSPSSPSVTGTPAITSSTAWYRFSMTLSPQGISGNVKHERSSCVKHQAKQET